MEPWVPLYSDSMSLDLSLTSPTVLAEQVLRVQTNTINAYVAARALCCNMEAMAFRLTSLVDGHVDQFYQGRDSDDACTSRATLGSNDMLHDEYFWGNIRATRPRRNL